MTCYRVHGRLIPNLKGQSLPSKGIDVQNSCTNGHHFRSSTLLGTYTSGCSLVLEFTGEHCGRSYRAAKKLLASAFCAEGLTLTEAPPRGCISSRKFRCRASNTRTCLVSRDASTLRRLAELVQPMTALVPRLDHAFSQSLQKQAVRHQLLLLRLPSRGILRGATAGLGVVSSTVCSFDMEYRSEIP